MNRTVPYIPYYQHVTQDDPFQIKSHLVHLLHQNISYHRALCRLLMSDFICFGYSLPMECHDMRDERGNYIPYGSTATVKKVEKGGKEKESKMV